MKCLHISPYFSVFVPYSSSHLLCRHTFPLPVFISLFFNKKAWKFPASLQPTTSIKARPNPHPLTHVLIFSLVGAKIIERFDFEVWLTMQVMSSSLSLSPSFTMYHGTGFSDIDGNFTHDFGVKLQFETDDQNKEQEEKTSNQPEIDEEEEEEEENEDEEFSFVCLNPDGSPISADDVFQNGQIRPVFPLFNQDLLSADEDGPILKSEEGEVSLRPPLRKLFVEDSPATTSSSSSDPVGPHCEWRRGGRTVEETSPNTCKKSNSTGFSKLWRVRDLMHRSSSDGKDAFVFLHHPPSTSSVKTEKKNEKEEKNLKVKETGEKPMVKKEKSGKTASLSAHEKLYVKNRAMREGDKRRSYLPYGQVGFFTNVNGLSRNVHPF
ncbi:uncharacterized protein LOC111287366 [Durio zibethinus]|uniref:Uncharacterized protein LOC111287366 n=1 Tax=Durio zibethinus TaxID=66656 RepID=A0A6P5XZQ6_DURZI|nr:uncharacterized protein LOC111287366 [Durio zibethinus]